MLQVLREQSPQIESAPQKSQPELPILPRSSTGGTSPHNESAPQKSRVDLPIFPRSSSKDSAAAENSPEAARSDQESKETVQQSATTIPTSAGQEEDLQCSNAVPATETPAE